MKEIDSELVDMMIDELIYKFGGKKLNKIDANAFLFARFEFKTKFLDNADEHKQALEIYKELDDETKENIIARAIKLYKML